MTPAQAGLRDRMRCMIFRAFIALLLCCQTSLSASLCMALFCSDQNVAMMEAPRAGMTPCCQIVAEPVCPPASTPPSPCSPEACPLDLNWVPTGHAVELPAHSLLAIAPWADRNLPPHSKPFAWPGTRASDARAASAKERCALVCVWRE